MNQRTKVLGGVAAVVAIGIGVTVLVLVSGDSPSDADAGGARAAVEEYLEAFGERDSATICAGSTPESWVDAPPGADQAECVRYYDRELDQILGRFTMDSQAESATTIPEVLVLGADTFTVEDVALSGTSVATARVSSTRPGVSLTVAATYEGDRWKITTVDF